MSTGYHVYLGPALVCTYTLVSAPRPLQSCTRLECNGHGQYASKGFCSRCGAPVALVPVPTLTNSPNHWDVVEQINQRLHPVTVLAAVADGENRVYWLGNRTDDGLRRTVDPRRVESAEVIEAADMVTEAEQFLSFYRAEMAALVKCYPEAVVRYVHLLWAS